MTPWGIGATIIIGGRPALLKAGLGRDAHGPARGGRLRSSVDDRLGRPREVDVEAGS